MVDITIGWALWNRAPYPDRVIRTVDGGVSWTDATPPRAFTEEETEQAYPSAFFLDSQHAWVIYPDGDAPVWRTVDGGASWSPSEQRFATRIPDLLFVTPSIGWMRVIVADLAHGSLMELFTTHDGGRTWVQPAGGDELPISCYGGMSFLADGYGWVSESCGFEGAPESSFLVTRDAGTTWEYPELPGPQVTGLFPNLSEYGTPGLMDCECTHFRQTSPHVFSRDNGALVRFCSLSVGSGGVACGPFEAYLYRTCDGGVTWTALPIPGRYVDYIDEASFWIASETPTGTAIYHSADGGTSWRLVKNTSWSGAIFFVNDFLAYALVRLKSDGSDSGPRHLLRSTDGSRTWRILSPKVVPSIGLSP